VDTRVCRSQISAWIEGLLSAIVLAFPMRWLFRHGVLVGLVAFLGLAFFHSGGVPSQNVRFAQVRALVEEGRLPVDSFLIYKAASDNLIRVPITDACCTLDGKTLPLSWPGAAALEPGYPDRDRTSLCIDDVAVGWDLSFHAGHFYPNKAPGTVFLAVPVYGVLFVAERALGMNPDDWWTMTVNAWLTTAFSVGLVSALGVVLFYWLATELGGGDRRAGLLATLAFAAGTIFLPYGTIFHEHNIVATALLAAFYCLYRAKGNPNRLSLFFLAGLSAGCAVLTNYVASVAVALLGLYLLSFTRTVRHVLLYALGAAVSLAALCAYHQVCFGSPFVTAYQFQNPAFKTSDAFLGTLHRPRLDVLLILLVSPYRGLFFGMPVLLMGTVGWCREKEHRAERLLFVSIVGLFLLFTCSFNAWDSGNVASRYLVPALPFLALPVVWGCQRFLKTTAVLTAISVSLMLVVTAVDPAHSRYFPPEPPEWRYCAFTDYFFPLFFTAGEVSVNTQGIYDPNGARVFGPNSEQCSWSAFNAGEFLFPESRLSLLPWLLGLEVAIFVVFRVETRPSADKPRSTFAECPKP
jgi:hypothetical protein